MGVDKAFSYDIPAVISDRTISIWGQPMTVWVPSRNDLLGYENQVVSHVVADSGNSYEEKFYWKETKGLIRFNVSKGVFYKFNWFPEKSEELVLGYFFSASPVKENCFIRTRGIEQVSYYGDMIFRVELIKDDGLYQPLKRHFFLRPVVDKQLSDLLMPRVQA